MRRRNNRVARHASRGCARGGGAGLAARGTTGSRPRTRRSVFAARSRRALRGRDAGDLEGLTGAVRALVIALCSSQVGRVVPTVDAEACPELDAQSVASTLALELDAEPGAHVAEGSVRIACTSQAVIIQVETAEGASQRTIRGPDRGALTERSFALAIAPLFQRFLAAEEPMIPSEAAHVDDTSRVTAPVATATDPAPEDPASVRAAPSHDIARGQESTPPPGPPPPVREAGTVRSPADRAAMIVRSGIVVHDAPGVLGQIGVIGWPTRRLGRGVVGLVRWGRARRDRSARNCRRPRPRRIAMVGPPPRGHSVRPSISCSRWASRSSCVASYWYRRSSSGRPRVHRSEP